jgi:hypothetical protein
MAMRHRRSPRPCQVGRNQTRTLPDFWLTRVGAGAGFWDGDYPEPQATLLTNASKRFGHVDVVEGEYGAGPLYLEPSIADARKHARRLDPEAFKKQPAVNHATRTTRASHATKKSPAQLDREIAQRVGKRIDRKKLGEMMSSWGGDFAYGAGTGAIGAVSSYYYDDKKYPDRTLVERALKAVEADAPKAEHGAHGWTKSDAKDLRTIASGLRYYLNLDYKG